MISLFAAEERAAKRERLGDPLQLLDRAIDYTALAHAVDARLEIADTGRGGRPPYPTELMPVWDCRVRRINGLSEVANQVMDCLPARSLN